MAVITSSVSIKGYFVGYAIGRTDIFTEPLIGVTTGAGTTLIDISLVSGNNVITVPAAATAVIINLDPVSTVIKRYKTSAGATGFPLNSSGVGGAMLIKLTPGIGSIILNASANDTGIITRVQFF